MNFLTSYYSFDHPDIVYLERYAHACCSPFGAAEQRSRWWNKTSNLSERQRVFDVPPLASSTGEPAGPASSGVFFLILLLDKQKKSAMRRAKINRGYNHTIEKIPVLVCRKNLFFFLFRKKEGSNESCRVDTGEDQADNAQHPYYSLFFGKTVGKNEDR